MYGEPLRGIVVQEKGKQKDKKDRGAWKESPKKCPLTLDIQPFRSQVKRKYSSSKEFRSLAVRGKILLTQTSL